jgi:hypothetical protein
MKFHAWPRGGHSQACQGTRTFRVRHYVLSCLGGNYMVTQSPGAPDNTQLTLGELKNRAERERRRPARATRQFNFARHWRKRIAPHLNDPLVGYALTIGLKLWDADYMPGKPPYRVGCGGGNGQRTRRGCLSWHQPWCRCHHIAPFSWALGTKLYPELNWGFIAGMHHTVAVGWSDDWRRPKWVLDILLFRSHSAEDSLNFAMKEYWEFYSSLSQYLAEAFPWKEVRKARRAVRAIFPSIKLPKAEVFAESQQCSDVSSRKGAA